MFCANVRFGEVIRLPAVTILIRLVVGSVVTTNPPMPSKGKPAVCPLTPNLVTRLPFAV